ncbi:transposase [Elysia marginata]|uniref:Transposase n=1 Tax=Elysia marginata TaxID=1093978 RepID=A0AAV4GX72_9GAST|nr:transposase [Elysia marginata]
MTFSSNSALLSSFLVAEGYSAANIPARIKTVYGEMCISKCQAQLMYYWHKTSPSPRKFRVDASARKVLFTLFWDMEGVVHMKFLKQGETVNYENDNARPHTSRKIQDALRQLELTTLPHLAIIPDLAPSDYYLFPQLKKYLKGHCYGNDEEFIAGVRRWCRGQTSEFFTDGIHQLLKCWRLCVDRDGDFVEK